MNSKKAIDLSPKVFRLVSIISIILIICNITMDVIFSNSINCYPIILAALLFVFCEYFRRNTLKNSNN